MKYKILSLISILAMTTQVGLAREIMQKRDANTSNSTTATNQDLGKTTGTCAQASAFTDLDINNIRAKIMNGGDMWWDRGTGTAKYEVPKGSGKNSLFAGSVWIGGYDVGGNLRVAAQTYRQGGGNDYWPGPLDNGTINDVECNNWDKIWKISLSEVLALIDAQNRSKPGAANYAPFDITDPRWDNIKTYPAYKNVDAQGKVGSLNVSGAGKTSQDYAPFIDSNGNNKFDLQTDYPDIKGDQFLWWVFNDNGGGSVKTETNTQSIGLEIQASAFAFLTNDQLNNATFYNYKLFNRSTTQLDSCSISTWTDADLGYYNDDYVGCDTSRSLGILYNGDDFDGTGLPAEYGANIPMIAVDFFEGPEALRWNQDSGKYVMKQLGMSSFVFYNNDGTPNLGNPQTGIEFYRYMTGSQRNGNKFTQTCNAVDPSINISRTVYWGDPSKPFSLATNWNECGCGNPPGDRRFVHSSGPFKLLVGASKPINVTIGAVWADNFTYPCPSFANILLADDKAQILFDRKFKAVQPPNAPIVLMRELDKKLVLYLDNPSMSNNINESYGNKFIEVSTKGRNLGYSLEKSTYKFEGYKIFQVKDSNITSGDIYNSDGSINSAKARLAFQCDVKNNVTNIDNYIEDGSASSTSPYYIRRQMVRGANQGIKKSFLATTDLFSSGNSPLVNYKRYYYLAVAYAYNNFKQFDAANTNTTQNEPYLESFKNGNQLSIRAVTGIPNPAYTGMGNQIGGDYGNGVEVRVLEGKGNGGNYLKMKASSENEALEFKQAKELVYEKGFGPIDVRIIDPIKVPSADFEVWLKGPSSPAGSIDTSRGLVPATSTWFIKNLTTNDTVFADGNLASVSEKLLAKYGLSVRIAQVERPGDNPETMGFIGDSLWYQDPTQQWLSGVKDQDGETVLNWIRSGSSVAANSNPVAPGYATCDYNDFALTYNDNVKIFMDPKGVLEKIAGGTFAPYILAANDNRASCGFGVGFMGNTNLVVSTSTSGAVTGGFFNTNYDARQANPIQKIEGVELVFTPDRNKWTKCAVVEMRDAVTYISGVSTNTYAEGGANKFDLRKHASLLKDPDGSGGYQYSSNPADYGTSWFPGYAINVETGERLNIIFGEDSYAPLLNGRDMVWNPTNDANLGLGAYIPAKSDYEAEFGGKHHIYISNTKYDEAADIVDKLKTDEPKTNYAQKVNKRKVYESIIWAGVPLLKKSYGYRPWAQGMIPTETRLSIRVNAPYKNYQGNPNFDIKNTGNPRYFFSTKAQTMKTWEGGTAQETSDLLKRMRVVPNPYYAYSAYEWNRLDNRVKIINLPKKVTLQIFSLDGVLVRKLTKDNEAPFIEWDLKNNAGIMISGGAYLIHVQAEGIGETVLKWFAAMKPTDITTF